VDEWERIRKVFPTQSTTFTAPRGVTHARDDRERRLLELAAAGKTLAEIALETRSSEFDAAARLFELHARGLVEVSRVEEDPWASDPLQAVQDLLYVAAQRLAQKRFDAAREAYEEVLSFDRLNQPAKKGLIAVAEARQRDRAVRTVPLDKVPVLSLSLAELTRENFDPQEGFVLSRINGQWDVRSILKLCPMTEDDALAIFARLLQRNVIQLS
jgi:hypothetical protein